MASKRKADDSMQAVSTLEKQDVLKRVRPTNELIEAVATGDALMQVDQVPDRTSPLKAPNMLLSGHEGHVFAARFNPQGSLLASASFDKNILFWKVFGDCENCLVLSGHQGAVLDLAWSANGQVMYSAGADKMAIVWDTETGERIKKIREHFSYINAVASSKVNNQVFVTGSDDGRVLVWDSRTLRGPQVTLCINFPVTALDLSRDSGTVFVGSIDPHIYMWDLRQNKVTASMPGHSETVTGLSVSPDGSFLLSNSMDNTVRCFDVRPFAPTERCVKTFYGASHDYEKNLLRCSWSPDGSQIAAGSADRFVYVWDATSSKILYKLPGHSGSVNDVRFHPSERIIASASSDHTLFLGELH